MSSDQLKTYIGWASLCAVGAAVLAAAASPDAAHKKNGGAYRRNPARPGASAQEVRWRNTGTFREKMKVTFGNKSQTITVRIQKHPYVRRAQARVHSAGVVTVYVSPGATLAKARQMAKKAAPTKARWLVMLGQRKANAKPVKPGDWAKARKIVETYIAKHNRRIKANVRNIQIRNCKRWGSFARGRGKMMINVRIAHVPPKAAEGLVIHELCHKNPDRHGPKWRKCMDTFCPSWKARDELLNQYQTGIP